MRRILTLVALSLFSLPALQAETAIELAERFALADDREVVVASLVPGTDEHFYYRCLLWQHQSKLAEVDALLPRWEALHPESGLRLRIHLRQAALWFDRDPVAGAQRLAEAGGMDFTIVEAPAVPAQEVVRAPELPSVLAANELSWETLIKRTESGGSITGWSNEGLARRVAELKDPVQRRAALKRLTTPTFPQVVELVLADLAEPGGDFGSLPLHGRLTIAQLQACRAARPELASDDDYVLTVIRALRHRQDETAWSRDSAARLAWVQELSRFAADLPPSAEALRTHLALHQLDLQLRAGQPTVAAITAVLAQPLPPGAVPRPNKGKPAQIQQAPSSTLVEATGLGDIHHTERLVSDALSEVFIAAPDTSAFAGLVDEDWLRRIFIESKLMHGVGDASQWLTRAEDADLGLQLKERVDLAFARSVLERFAGDAVVELPLVLKNVPELRVRLYALDAVNLYRSLNGEPTTAIDLAGVVPTHERALAFAQVPIRRHRERLLLPECAGPGLWLVELVGGGQVARALVRKGNLRFYSELRADGEHLKIYDETDRAVPAARVWQGDQQFVADADGSVRLPFVVERRSQPLVLAGAGRAAVTSYTRVSESWRLEDGALLDREQLIAGGRATALLRPRLFLNGREQPFSHARDVRVIVTTTTHSDTRQVTTVEPQGDPRTGEWSITFPVPEGLASVTLTLRATVRNQALGKDETLNTGTWTAVNANHWTDRIVDVQLEQMPDGWSLLALGRAGEPIAGEVLMINFHHRLVNATHSVALQTAADGRVHLGPLAGVTMVGWEPPTMRLHATGSERLGQMQQGRRWELRPHLHQPSGMTIVADQPLRLPATWRVSADGARDWWLLRGDEKATADDLSETVRMEAQGGVPVLVIAGLPAGNYSLFTPLGDMPLRVVAGTVRDQVVLSPTAIEEVTKPTVLGVGATLAGDGVQVQVVHATPSTRVQVLGLRFHPPLGRWFPNSSLSLNHWPQSDRPSSYQDGMPLDAELRYILDRSRAVKLPGVMLERPGLVLNPWHDDSFMAVGAGDGSVGMFGSRNGGGKRRALAKGGGSRGSEPFTEAWSQLDFLPAPGVVLANLRPDAAGVVRLTAAQLGDARELLVIACDATQEATAVVPLAQRALATRERRLLSGLPAKEHLVADRQGRALLRGAQAIVSQGGLDRNRTCATVPELFRLLVALAPDLELAEFEPLTRWLQLSEAERRTWYSDHACHEVHLFLWRKDRRFFDAVVRPYLANKLQKTFIDGWLLELDVTPWLAPDRHQRLNLAERILLARRLVGEAQRQELASLAEEFVELPDVTAELGQCFATALMDHSLAVSPAPAVNQRQIDGAGKAAQQAANPLVEKKELDLDIENDIEINIAAEVNAPVAPPTAKAAMQDYRDHAAAVGLIEQNWYRVPVTEHHASLFAASRFWQDFAAWDGKAEFLSPTCLLATTRRSEALLALAFSDLPFTAEAPTWKDVAGGARQLTAATPLLLFTQAVAPMALQPGEQLVHQRLYRLDHLPENSSSAKPIEGPLMPGVAYLVRSVVLNPTPQPVTVAVLAQSPTGAVPLYASEATVAEERAIGPYGSTVIDLAFYLPLAGEFTHFPTHVRTAQAVTAAVASTTVTAGGRANRTHGGGWPDEPAAILERLASAPRTDLDFSGLHWRFTDAAFWHRCVEVLERRRLFDSDVWAFSVLHRDVARMGVWLRDRTDLVEQLGQTLKSKWLTIDPLSDGGVTHADVAPLTNRRAHRRADEPIISNELVATLWSALVTRLGLEPQLDDRARLELAYALTLQNRHRDASAYFARIDRARITAQLQYDYLGAYLAIARGDLEQATRFAAVGKDHPVDRWRLRFAEVQAQLDELAGRPVVREEALGEQQRQSVQAAQTPTFQARFTEAGTLLITASNLATCTVRWHRLDLEPLFSRAPFATATAAQVTQVRAAVEQEVRIAADGSVTVPVPDDLRRQTLAIEVVGAGQRQQLTRFADNLDVRLSPGSGQLQVRHATTGKPLPATYVKVYTEQSDGSVVFHKDGYTDLRGRFDYASVGDGSVSAAKRLALFISHDEAGATVREVSPP